jgi:hypothetical protein
MIPETQFGSNGTASLKITVDEGPQYRMGNLNMVAGRELAARLAARWKLLEGDVYDQAYLDRYIQANRDLLPARFNRGDAFGTRDCPNALIHLRLVIDPDLDPSQFQRKNIPCEDQHLPIRKLRKGD